MCDASEQEKNLFKVNTFISNKKQFEKQYFQHEKKKNDGQVPFQVIFMSNLTAARYTQTHELICILYESQTKDALHERMHMQT